MKKHSTTEKGAPKTARPLQLIREERRQILEETRELAKRAAELTKFGSNTTEAAAALLNSVVLDLLLQLRAFHSTATPGNANDQPDPSSSTESADSPAKIGNRQSSNGNPLTSLSPPGSAQADQHLLSPAFTSLLKTVCILRRGDQNRLRLDVAERAIAQRERSIAQHRAKIELRKLKLQLTEAKEASKSDEAPAHHPAWLSQLLQDPRAREIEASNLTYEEKLDLIGHHMFGDSWVWRTDIGQPAPDEDATPARSKKRRRKRVKKRRARSSSKTRSRKATADEPPAPDQLEHASIEANSDTATENEPPATEQPPATNNQPATDSGPQTTLPRRSPTKAADHPAPPDPGEGEEPPTTDN